MIPVKYDGPALTVDTNETNTKQNKIEKNRLMSVNKNNVSAIYIAAVVVVCCCFRNSDEFCC